MCSNLIRPSGDTRFVMTWITCDSCDHQICLAKGHMTATEYQRMVGATDRMPLIRRIWFKKLFHQSPIHWNKIIWGDSPTKPPCWDIPTIIYRSFQTHSFPVLFIYINKYIYIYIYMYAHYVIILSPQIQTKTSQWLSRQSLQHVKMRQHVSVVSGTFPQAPDLKSFLGSDRSDAQGSWCGTWDPFKGDPTSWMQVRFRLVAASVSGSLKWT